MSASPSTFRPIGHAGSSDRSARPAAVVSPPPTSSTSSTPEPAKVAASGVRGCEDSIARRTGAAQPSLQDAARSGAVHASPSAHSSPREALLGSLLARVPVADRPAAKIAIPAIIDAARKAGSADPNQLGYMLATAQTESDFGQNMVEKGHSHAWFDRNYGAVDGNRPGTSDGYTYRGRGYVQTTHAGRYAELSHRLGLPDVPALERGKPVLDGHGRQKMEPALVAHPDRLTEPALAARALVVGIKHNLFTHNRAAALDKTIPAGRKPGDADFYHARAIVNGIVKDQAQAIAAHAGTYARILAAYRHSVLDVPESTPAPK